MPPNAGAPLGAAVFPLAPPNWKGVDAPDDGADEPPKLNMPPVDGAAEPLPPAPPAPPDVKGLLKDVVADLSPPAEKLNPKPPEPALAELSDPKDADVLLPFVVALLVAPPKMLVDGALEAPPKLNVGAADPAALPPVNCFLAGDWSSCFIGLPNMLLVLLLAGGDFGAPKSGFCAGAAVEVPVVLPPKLNTGVDEPLAGASDLGADEAPKRDAVGAAAGAAVDAVEPAPNRLVLGAAVDAGLAPNKDGAVVAGCSPVAGVDTPEFGADGSSEVVLAGSEALPPKSVDDCITGVDSSGLLVAGPKRLDAAGAAVFEAPPKRLAAGLEDSEAVSDVALAGFCWKREPNGCWPAGVLDLASNIGFLAGWESFSLSDSPPSLSVSAAGAFFSEGASCFAAPNKLEGAEIGRAHV